MNNTNSIQVTNHRKAEYEILQELIFDKSGVVCTAMIKDRIISLRTKDYADFLIARSVIKGRTSKEILRDFETLEVVK